MLVYKNWSPSIWWVYQWTLNIKQIYDLILLTDSGLSSQTLQYLIIEPIKPWTSVLLILKNLLNFI